MYTLELQFCTNVVSLGFVSNLLEMSNHNKTMLAIKAHVGKSKMNSAKKNLPPLGIEPGASFDPLWYLPHVTLVRGRSTVVLLFWFCGCDLPTKDWYCTFESGRNKSDTSPLIEFLFFLWHKKLPDLDSSFVHLIRYLWLTSFFLLGQHLGISNSWASLHYKELLTLVPVIEYFCKTKILFYTICPKISSKTRMPGKWGGARRARPP